MFLFCLCVCRARGFMFMWKKNNPNNLASTYASVQLLPKLPNNYNEGKNIIWAQVRVGIMLKKIRTQHVKSCRQLSPNKYFCIKSLQNWRLGVQSRYLADMILFIIWVLCVAEGILILGLIERNASMCLEGECMWIRWGLIWSHCFNKLCILDPHGSSSKCYMWACVLHFILTQMLTRTHQHPTHIPR